MTKNLSIFIIFISLIQFTYASEVGSFSESKIWQYLNQLPKDKLSTECLKSLEHVVPMLTSHSTLEQQRQFFYKSFASGEREQLISLEMDRWFHKSLECLKVAGETTFSVSDYPVHYCFASNHKPKSKAYGICIPSTCEKDRQILLKSFQFIASNGTDKSALDYSECTKSRYENQWYKSPIPLTHLGFDFILSLLVVLGTIYDIKRGGVSSSVYGQILIAFSYTRNCIKLVQMPKDPKSTIKCMFGLRFLFMCWTLVGHSFFFAQSFIENVDDFKRDLVDNFGNLWISNFTLGVDVFFMLSGTLLTYSFFKKFPITENDFSQSIINRDNKQFGGLAVNLEIKCLIKKVPGFTSIAYWLRFYRHRLIRLWPAYMYVLVSLTTRLSVTHWHPMWPPTDPNIQCSAHWPTNILLINSIFGNMCMPWTWYISCEFIFYLFAPLFLIGMHKSVKMCIFLSISVILLSSLLNALTMYAYSFPPTPLALKPSPIFNPDFMQHHLTMYIKPWFRVGPYIVGLLLGYYLSKLAKMEKPTIRSTQFMTIGWLLSILSAFWAIYGIYPATQGWNWTVYHYLYGAFHRTIFSMSFGWLVYACHTGRAKVLNSILGSRIFLPLSSLSYSVYLVHLIAVAFTYLIVPFPMQFTSKWPFFAHCLVQLILSYFMAGRVNLVAELPVLNIERILKQWRRNSRLESSKTVNDDKLKEANQASP